MGLAPATPKRQAAYGLLLTAIAMSLGWRIRGQFGHETGAVMPGVLAALAVVLASGRDDWRGRLPSFALLGALGWAFGGSISYMKVVGYCHSSDSATVFYGFAGLYLIGFVWSALGGAGVALSAVLDERRLASLFPTLIALFVAWLLVGMAVDWLEGRDANLDWFDTDWIFAAAALVTALLVAAARRRIDLGASLVLHLAIGWWIAFLVLVVALGWRLNPPRGDNWAGCVGLVGGLLVFCWRQGLTELARASLVTGLLGGLGFTLGQMIKLALIAAGASMATHATMEWLHGLLFGLALAVAMQSLARRTPTLDGGSVPRYSQVFALLAVLWFIPYVNFAKCPEQWIKLMPSLAGPWHGLPLVARLEPSRGWIGWVDLVFLAWGAALWALLLRQRRQPSLAIPDDWHGRGQLLLLVLAWTFTFTSFARDVTNFGSGEELLVQVAITLHAVLCTVVVLWPAKPLLVPPEPDAGAPLRVSWRVFAVAGLIAVLATSLTGLGVKRLLHGDHFAPGFYMDHIRFGPASTNDQK